MKIVVIRQRSAIGDCLLLAPFIMQLRKQHAKSFITVITDARYMSGALPTVFKGVPGIDRVEIIDSMEWTTEGNRRVDRNLLGACTKPLPYTVRSADLVFDCNSAFIEFEREHNGKPPYGIAEFWTRHHGYYEEGMSLLPVYQVPDGQKRAVDKWLSEKNPDGRPMVGIVLRAGDRVRDWDYGGKSDLIATYLHCNNYLPVGIDPIRPLTNVYSISCIGKPLDFVAALLERCRLVITPDNGLLHLAEAVGTPQVALWGIMPPRLRVEGYKCVVVPKQSLGFCETHNELRSCECRWRFQQWSCLRRLTPNLIIEGIEEAMYR